MKRHIRFLIAIAFCAFLVLPLPAFGYFDGSPDQPQATKRMDPHEKTSTVGGHFSDAGREVKSHYGKAGESMGHGGKELGVETAKGKPIKGSVEFGKGVGGFGKDVGVGTGKAAASTFKGVANGLGSLAKRF